MLDCLECENMMAWCFFKLVCIISEVSGVPLGLGFPEQLLHTVS